MHLTIDIGNSRTKLGLFQEGELLKHALRDGEDLRVHELIEDATLSGIILSSVRDTLPGPLKEELPLEPLILDHNIPLPIGLDLLEPWSLGPDRLANAVAAASLYPDEEVLVVDIGTCITYERVRKGVLDGGAISPGVRMRARAMHHFTGKLPEVQVEETPDRYARDTEASLQAGIYYGVLDEIKGWIAAFQNDPPEGVVVLTGGDVPLVGKEFKKRTFADPFLTLRGLDAILRYHKENDPSPDRGSSPSA